MIHARRPGLDGLRALAVTAVVVYHFGGGAPSVLPGGFVGVDAFFVLSGYLITGLLLDERTRSGGIDLRAFWTRRLRRLLPASLVVLLVVVAWSWWAGPPQQWASVRGDVLATLGYVANWRFVVTGQDYFAGYAAASPVRHAWSLAVEEQFYLVWPLLVVGVGTLTRRRDRPMAGPLAVLASVLLVASVVLMAVESSASGLSRAYYGTDGRAQELLVGALLAIFLRVGRPASLARWNRLAGRSGIVALVLLLAGFVVVREDSAVYYRGGALALAVVVAALVGAVEVAPGSALTSWLGLPPAAHLGRISYGVYLWHWPVVLAVPADGGPGRPGWWLAQAGRLLITLGLAELSHRFVEQPVLRARMPGVGRSHRRTWVVAACGVALVAVAATSVLRLPGGLQAQLDDRADRPCPGERVDHLVSCTVHIGRPEGRRMLLLGDSTARALEPGLAQQAAQRGDTLVQAAFQRCSATGLMVLPNGAGRPDLPARTCAQQAAGAIDAALEEHRPDVVLVSEFWTHHQRLIVDGRTLDPGTPEHDAELERAFVLLVDRVARVGGRTVFIELPPPGGSIGPAVASGRPAGIDLSPGGAEFVDRFNLVLRRVAATRPVAARTVQVTDLLCPGGPCPAVQDGRVVRSDGVHVTASTSRRLAPELVRRVDLALGEPD